MSVLMMQVGIMRVRMAQATVMMLVAV